PVQMFWLGASSEAYSRYASMSGASDAWIRDGWYIRLNNVSLTWNCPQTWLRSSRLNGVRVSIHGQNLWNSDRENRYDPETMYNQMPPLRMIRGSLQISL